MSALFLVIGLGMAGVDCAVVVTVGAGVEEGASEVVDCCRIVGRVEEVPPAGVGSQPEVLVGLGVRREVFCSGWGNVCSWSCLDVSGVADG